MNNETTPASHAQERYMLESLAGVRKLVLFKLGSSHRDAAEDLMHRIFYKLWSWKTRRGKVLERGEWQRLTRTAARSEINEYFSEKYRKDILFSQMDEQSRETVFGIKSTNIVVEDLADVRSALIRIWEAAQILTLRQRYAFVLQSDDFLLEFTAAGFCSRWELAAYFELGEDEMTDLLRLLPLSDGQIGELLEAKLNESILPQHIWEARSKAKSKLAKAFKQIETKEQKTG